jgi:hypothetical protein
MASMRLSIARNIARTNMRRAGMTKINKQHTYTSKKKGMKASKAFNFTTESIFGRNWRKFATSAATRWSLRQAEKQSKKKRR